MESISVRAHNFLSQKTIAIVGISSAKQTVSNGVYKKLKPGNRKIFAVGRNTATFENDPCYPDLASLPVHVDGVFIAAGEKNIESATAECVALNIPRLWIHNFKGKMNISENTPVPPSALSSKIVQTCRDHHITLIPGACPMMFTENADFGHACIRWFLSVTGKLNGD